MQRSACVCLALLTSTAACVDEPEVATEAPPLMVPESVQLWTSRGNVIPLCWLEPGDDEAKALVRAAVARTWAAAAPLDVRWREGCPTDGEERWVRVVLKLTARVSWTGGRATAGTAALSSPGDPVWCRTGEGDWDWEMCAGMTLMLPLDLVSARARRRAEYIAIHEFGHVLGFGHEQDRTDAPACIDTIPEPGLLIGPYDPTSVMNYCNADSARLSEGDVVGVRAVYGRLPVRTDALADLDGDRLVDAIATNRDGSYAISSTGFGFADWRPITGAFYGQRATAYVDIDGDRAADAVAVNDDAIYTLRSNGYTLDRWARWTSAPAFGRRVTLFGDIDGDERADVVGVNDDGTCVWLSTWIGFWSVGCDGVPSYGALQTELADVTGDGRADLIANHGRDGLWVRPARDPDAGLGAGFEAGFGAWSAPGEPAFFADRELAFADVDGDRHADAIAVRFDGLHVRRSTGARFERAVRWTDGPAVGQRATRFGDVTGDELADVVLIDDAHDLVLVSDGARFIPFGAPWTGWPFYTLP